jgi:phosphohistidine swiveling domain-containing protein
MSTDGFPVAWEHPSDPDHTWEWDDMHMPFALAPLAEDYIRVLALGFNAPYETFGGFPQRWYGRVWNGYAYFAHVNPLPEAERAANSERWQAVTHERVDATERYWADDVLPEVRALETKIRTTPVETLAPVDLAVTWDEAWAAVARLWELHFCAIVGPYLVIEDLADLYEAAVPEASSGESMRLIQGARHELLETELEMELLAATVARHPAIAAVLTEQGGPVNGTGLRVQPADLEGLPGGPEILAELDGFLERHGHLGQGFDDLTLPSWADAPAIVLAALGMRLLTPPEPAEERRTRLAAEAEALAHGVRARLADRPAELARFEELLRLSRAIGPLTEVHNYWIDRMAQARIRTFAMRVGDRLVANGVMDAADDVFFLHRQEVRDAIERPVDLRPLVAERRAEHARRQSIVPPRHVGAAPGAPDNGRFDGERFTSDDPNLLQGTGASAGVVRGPARIAVGPADFERIRAGDVIVCPSSNPSWVPVFTIAAGLVTNTGGVLCHAAVVAREFGLPAVVGTGDATTRIAEGRLVEIDGTKGTVRLL